MAVARGQQNTSLAAVWLVVVAAAALCQHAAHARVSPQMAKVASAAAVKDGEGTNWSVGDIFVASHNDVGFPRIDILDAEDLTVKDTVDLVPACGAHSRTQGLSFSPRFSTMKLQLAASCAPGEAGSGKVVLLAAKHPQHPILRTLSVPNAAASIFNRSGMLYVFGTIPWGGGAAEAQAPAAAKGSQAGGNTTAPAAAAPAHNSAQTAAVGIAAAAAPAAAGLPVFLYKFDAAAHAASSTHRQKQQPKAADATNTTATPPAPSTPAADTAADAVEVAAVMPTLVTSADAVAMDLGTKGSRLFYTVNSNNLKTYDLQAGEHLRDRPLPAHSCTALQAMFDEGSVLVACGKCLYHVAADEAVRKWACLPVSAPFGNHMAIDPEGANVLISTTDGNLHVIRLEDFERVQSTSLAGRKIGGLAVLGTVLANQQDCVPGTGCCPFGRILPSDTVCRKASTACAEDAVCNGVSPLCPENPPKTQGAVCRQPSKPCMEPASCDGITDKCPPNPVSAKGAVCTNGLQGNVCAAQGECDGKSEECPAAETQNDGTKCAWLPDDDFNVFKHDTTTPHVSAFQSAVQTYLPTAVQLLSTLAARAQAGTGRKLQSEQSMSSADSALFAVPRSVGGSSKARPLGVCQGTCTSSKCVMTASRKGCCVLPGSRLAEDEEASTWTPTPKKAPKKLPRGTEEDLYCWDA